MLQGKIRFRTVAPRERPLQSLHPPTYLPTVGQVLWLSLYYPILSLYTQLYIKVGG